MSDFDTERKKRIKLGEAYKRLCVNLDELEDENSRLLCEVSSLKEKLSTYGRHHPDCAILPHVSPIKDQCDCGFFDPVSEEPAPDGRAPREWEVLPDDKGWTLSIRQQDEGERGWIKVREVL